MSQEMLEYCKKKINNLVKKKLIRPSHCPWNCATSMQTCDQLQATQLSLKVD